MRRLSSLALILLVALPTQPAPACLAEYRSVEWMAEKSRLVFVGRIEAVTPVGNQKDRHEDQVGVAAITTVRLVRILRGEWRKPTIEIWNGPIPS